MTAYDDTIAATVERDRLRRRHEPNFTPLDVMALLVGALMVWGPLAAATLRH